MNRTREVVEPTLKIAERTSEDRSQETEPQIEYPIRYSATRIHRPDISLLEKNRILNTESSSELEYTYKVLRTQIIAKLSKNGWNSFAVMSAHAGEGVTLTATNLAISIAMDPRYTVLLVDFNFKRPALGQLFGYDAEIGIADILNGGAKIQDALFNPDIEGLLILPGNKRIRNSSELLSAPKTVKLVQDLRLRYPSRIVIFDLPPLLESEDAAVFLQTVDAGLMVISDGVTKKSETAMLAQLLKGKPLLGTVLNKT